MCYRYEFGMYVLQAPGVVLSSEKSSKYRFMFIFASFRERS